MNAQTPATTQETQAPATPGRLDGVVIDSCVFTESVGKREPRPPLYLAIVTGGPWRGEVLPNVFLAVPGGRVLVDVKDYNCQLNGAPPTVGAFANGAPKGPAYTGPITPAMWVWINRWWKP